MGQYKCIVCEQFTEHVVWKKDVFTCLDKIECTKCGTRMQRAKLERK